MMPTPPVASRSENNKINNTRRKPDSKQHIRFTPDLPVTGANEFFDMMRLIKRGGVIPIRIVIDIFAYKIVTNILHRMKIKVYICRTFNNGRTKLFSYE